MSEPPVSRLVVVARTVGSPGRWAALARDVALVAGTSVNPWVAMPWESPGAPGAAAAAVVEAMLALAKTTPILVLPRSDPLASEEHPRLRRVLMPIDQSLSERRAVLPMITRARSLGVEVRVLHALDDATRPRMWEGPGHDAQAWYSELRRRYEPEGATLRVGTGDPADEIILASADVDVVAVCWHGDASPPRAKTLRALLERLERPVLLMPIFPVR